MQRSEYFIKVFNPYRSKYIIQGQGDIFGQPDWYTVHKYLSVELIESAIIERIVCGYFSTHSTKVITFDIDAHNRPDIYAVNIYNQVVNKLQCYPSLLFKTPHGLHASWVLDQRIPIDTMKSIISGVLGALSKQVEIRPTSTQGLRIPVEKKALHPETLQLLNISFEMLFDNMQVYHPAQVFGESFLPANIRNSLQSRKRQTVMFRALPRIEQAEEFNLPFMDGMTNEPFTNLCLTYRSAGLTEAEAFYRFKLCLERSVVYSGDLRNPQRLQTRIASFYKNKRDYVHKPAYWQPTLLQELIADRIGQEFYKYCSNSANKQAISQRVRGLKRLIYKILSWKEYHDSILDIHGLTATLDFAYKYYRKNRREGYYPLPYVFLRQINFRYYSFMPFLQDIGFLEVKTMFGYTWSRKLSICKYYKIHEQPFI